MSIDSLDFEDSQLYHGDSNQRQVLRPRPAAARVGAEFELNTIADVGLDAIGEGFHMKK
jgi:hypothetical protein